MSRFRSISCTAERVTQRRPKASIHSQLSATLWTMFVHCVRGARRWRCLLRVAGSDLHGTPAGSDLHGRTDGSDSYGGADRRRTIHSVITSSSILKATTIVIIVDHHYGSLQQLDATHGSTDFSTLSCSARSPHKHAQHLDGGFASICWTAASGR